MMLFLPSVYEQYVFCQQLMKMLCLVEGMFKGGSVHRKKR